MACTNQGTFKKIRADYNDLEISYNDLCQRYTELKNDGSGYEISDEIYNFEYLYNNSEKSIINCSGVLKFNKFADNKRANEYKEMAENSEAIKRDIFEKFSHIMSEVGCENLTDAERETLMNTKIGRDYYNEKN